MLPLTSPSSWEGCWCPLQVNVHTSQNPESQLFGIHPQGSHNQESRACQVKEHSLPIKGSSAERLSTSGWSPQHYLLPLWKKHLKVCVSPLPFLKNTFEISEGWKSGEKQSRAHISCLWVTGDALPAFHLAYCGCLGLPLLQPFYWSDAATFFED